LIPNCIENSDLVVHNPGRFYFGGWMVLYRRGREGGGGECSVSDPDTLYPEPDQGLCLIQIRIKTESKSFNLQINFIKESFSVPLHTVCS
jgi:hypothetical protein